MEWCRLTAGYYRDPAVVRAGEAAEVLFVRMISYCAETETGGRVPVAYLPNLTPTKTVARRDALLREGLIVRDGADVVLRSWERIQSAHDAGVERKRKDRERKAAARAAERAGTVHGTSADTSADSPQTVQPMSARKEVEEEKDNIKPSSSADADFDEFWQHYPRKIGKQSARKAYTRALKLAPGDVILAGVLRYAAERKGEDPTYTAHPDTWLNQGRWDDEPTPPRLAPVPAWSRIPQGQEHLPEHERFRAVSTPDGGTPDWTAEELAQ